MQRRRILIAGVLIAVLVTGALAQEMAEVLVGDTLILQLRVTVAGMTPRERAAALYERLNRIIADRSIEPAHITAVQKGNDWVVMAGPRLFVTVVPAEARINQSAPQRLAQRWATNLATAVQRARPLPVPPAGP